MDFLSSIFENLFSDGAADGVAEFAGGLLESGDRDGERRSEAPYVYERYLCGGPATLGINDR